LQGGGQLWFLPEVAKINFPSGAETVKFNFSLPKLRKKTCFAANTTAKCQISKSTRSQGLPFLSSNAHGQKVDFIFQSCSHGTKMFEEFFLVLGLQSPGHLLPGQLPPRTTATKDYRHPGTYHHSQLPPSKIATWESAT